MGGARGGIGGRTPEATGPTRTLPLTYHAHAVLEMECPKPKFKLGHPGTGRVVTALDAKAVEVDGWHVG